MFTIIEAMYSLAVGISRIQISILFKCYRPDKMNGVIDRDGSLASDDIIVEFEQNNNFNTTFVQFYKFFKIPILHFNFLEAFISAGLILNDLKRIERNKITLLNAVKPLNVII